MAGVYTVASRSESVGGMHRRTEAPRPSADEVEDMMAAFVVAEQAGNQEALRTTVHQMEDAGILREIRVK